jgi:hypothetical protein
MDPDLNIKEAMTAIPYPLLSQKTKTLFSSLGESTALPMLVENLPLISSVPRTILAPVKSLNMTN